uniref:C2H2-type domain-containing protein n=1 Tax=Glossina brevipalpis TaxID=37001 RepID=A0A1A9W6L4_9MUSC
MISSLSAAVVACCWQQSMRDIFNQKEVPSLASTLHHHHQSKHGSSSTIADDDSSRDITTSSPGLQPANDFMVTCPQCHMRLNGFESLRDHIAIEHPNDKLNIEPSFPSPREEPPLLRHPLVQQQSQQRHSKSTVDSDDNESNLSSIVDNKSHNNNNNNNNSQMKNNNIDLQISSPGSTGGSDNNSATSTSTNNGPYQCMHCTALFQTRDQLEKHELMHSPNAQSPQSSQPQNGVNQATTALY